MAVISGDWLEAEVEKQQLSPLSSSHPPVLCTYSPRALVNSSGFKCEKSCHDWQTEPREHIRAEAAWPVFLPFSFWTAEGVSVDKNHLLSCSDLGRDSVIPSPWSVRRPGGKEQRRGGGIDFQSEGMRRIELRCVAQTGFERSFLLAGKQTSVAYSRGGRAIWTWASPSNVNQLHSCLSPFPPPARSASLPCPAHNSARRPLDKQVVL